MEDWFKDGTTIVRTLRNGRGRNPYIDSTVTLRLAIWKNDELVLSNYPEIEPLIVLPEEYGQTVEELKQQEGTSYDVYTSENLKRLPKDARPFYLEK